MYGFQIGVIYCEKCIPEKEKVRWASPKCIRRLGMQNTCSTALERHGTFFSRRRDYSTGKLKKTWVCRHATCNQPILERSRPNQFSPTKTQHLPVPKPSPRGQHNTHPFAVSCIRQLPLSILIPSKVPFQTLSPNAM